MPRLWQQRDLECASSTKNAHDYKVAWQGEGSGLGKRQPPQWVISRQACVYKTLDYNHVSRADRQEALNLKVDQISPFTTSGHAIVWDAGVAMVWLWDAAVQQQLMEQQGVISANALPETLLQTLPPQVDSKAHLRVVNCRDGLDVQVWKGGLLAYSQWCTEGQSADILAQAARSYSLSVPSAGLQPVDPGAWLSKPWGRQGADELAGMAEKWLPRSAVVIFLIIVAWSLGGGWAWQRAENAVAEEIDALEVKIQSILIARDTAVRTRSKIDQFGSLQLMRQSDLLLDVSNRLPKDAVLGQFTYQQDELVIEITSAQQDPRFYVRAFQKGPRFSGVDVQSLGGKGNLRIRMKVASS